MHVISKKKLKDFWERHASSKSALEEWFKVLRNTRYSMWAELKRTFGDKVDKVGKYTVFDVGGNKCRIITVVHLNRAKVYIRDVLTHSEYDREKWKDG